MGGGGPLAFLNKKTWHPASTRNMEEVWKREQKQAAEEKKAEELKKQIEEERKRDEFLQVASDAGYRREEKLDWMYAGSLAAKEDAAKRREEMLTGKIVAVVPQEQQQDTSTMEQASLLPSFYANATPASQNETWLRLNNDPLFAIKRQQQEQLKKLRENPIKMAELLKAVAAKKQEKEEKKKHKKEKKHKSKDKEHKGGNSDGDREIKRPLAVAIPQQSADVRGNGEPPSKRPRSRSPQRASRTGHYDRHDEAAPRHQDSGDLERHHPDSRPARLQDNGHAANAKPRAHDSWAREERAGHSERHRDGRHDSHRRSDRDRYEDNGRHRQDHRDVDEQDHRAGSRAEHRTSDEPLHREDKPEHGHKQGTGSREDRDTGTGSRYGLAMASHAPDAVREYNTSSRAAETRARLEEGRLKKEEEDKQKAGQRFQRKEFKIGQLTGEERERRLAEMMGDADQHEKQRLYRLKQAREAEGEDKIVSYQDSHRGADAFRQAASKEVYGALSAGGGSLEARVNSRKHFSAR